MSLMKIKKERVIPSYERVRELFDYNEITGIMTRKVTVGINGTALEGRIVGHLDTKGYLNVRVDNFSFKLHRIIWLWWYGYWSENQIDHINRIKHDNRICNMREYSQVCNSRNLSARKDSVTGVNGVHLYGVNKVTGAVKYVAVIGVNYKSNFLVVTEDLVEAVAYRLAAEQCMGWPMETSNTARVIREYVCRTVE